MNETLTEEVIFVLGHKDISFFNLSVKRTWSLQTFPPSTVTTLLCSWGGTNTMPALSMIGFHSCQDWASILVAQHDSLEIHPFCFFLSPVLSFLPE